MRRADILQRRCINGVHQQFNYRSGSGVTVPSLQESENGTCEDELERLHSELETAALFVFQQRLAIYRLTGDVYFPEEAERHVELSCNNSADCKAAIDKLVYLEDNLSQAANQYIRTFNVTALHLLNEKQFSRAFQILLQVEVIVQKGAGKLFSFNTKFAVKKDDGFVQSRSRNSRGGNEECYIQETLVPFFTKRHETMRQLALAVVENNIGLYHFKIAEYKLAVQRISCALQLEETHGVKTIGVTYFNLAQAVYAMGNIKDAFSAITLAEDAIEEQLHEFQSQKNYFSRIKKQCAAIPATTTTAALTDLGKRSLAVYVSWREAVCMLSRVLEVHGGWLQNKGDYRAAIDCYEKSESWLLSVNKLSAEEKLQRRELRLRVEECRRSHRHSGCVPKTRAKSSSGPCGVSSAPPRSVIVTSALPHGTEFITHTSLLELEENNLNGEERKEESKPQKPRYTDVNEMSAVTGRSPRVICSSASKERGATATCRRRRSLWDPSTNIDHGKTTRDRPVPSATVSRINSAYRALSRRKSCTSTRPSLQQESKERVLSEPSALCFDSEEAASVKTGGGRSPKFARHYAPKVVGGDAAVNRVSCSSDSGETFSSLPSCKIRVLSLVRCVHTLQAFARAKISLVVKEFRQVFLGLKLISSTSRSFFSLLHFSPFASLFRGRLLEKIGDSFVGEAVSFTTKRPLDVCGAVLLAFLAARRSTRLVCQRKIGQRYANIMREVTFQSSSPPDSQPPSLNKTRVMMMMNNNGDKTDKNDCEHVQQKEEKEVHELSELSSSLATRLNNAQNSDSPSGHICKKDSSSSSVFCSCNDINSDDVSEKKFHRRYNSLLRVFPQGGNMHIFSDNKVADVIARAGSVRLNNGSTLSPTDVGVGSPGYSGLPATPHTAEDSEMYDVGVDCFVLQKRTLSTLASGSATRQGIRGSSNVSADSCVCIGRYEETVRNMESAACNVWNGDYSSCLHNGLPPRRGSRSERASSLSLSRYRNGDVNNTTAKLIRQRIVREGAAMIIQTAWRNWRVRRQLDAVREFSLSLTTQ